MIISRSSSARRVSRSSDRCRAVPGTASAPRSGRAPAAGPTAAPCGAGSGEVEVRRAADEDVRRITDERCGAADVCRQDLADDEGEWAHPQARGQEQRDRSDQHDRRDVVEERAGDRGDDAHHDEHAVAVAAGESRGPNGQPAEDAGLPDDAGQDHHSGQQEDDVEVDRLEGLLLGDDAEEHHRHPAGQRGQRLVHALGGDDA